MITNTNLTWNKRGPSDRNLKWTERQQPEQIPDEIERLEPYLSSVNWCVYVHLFTV